MKTTLLLLALAAGSLGGCAFAYSTSPGMDGTVVLSEPLTGEPRPASAQVSSFRFGLSATYVARLTLYGQFVTAKRWRAEAPLPLEDTEASLFGVELGVPVLLPWVLASEPLELESQLSRVLFVTGGIAGAGEGSARHVGLGLNLDLFLGALYLGAAHHWIELDVQNDLVTGRGELRGWTVELGLSLPGDLVLFGQILENFSIPLL